jgi:Skp family chaperone for outer membrane proteins
MPQEQETVAQTQGGSPLPGLVGAALGGGAGAYAGKKWAERVKPASLETSVEKNAKATPRAFVHEAFTSTADFERRKALYAAKKEFVDNQIKILKLPEGQKPSRRQIGEAVRKFNGGIDVTEANLEAGKPAVHIRTGLPRQKAVMKYINSSTPQVIENAERTFATIADNSKNGIVSSVADELKRHERALNNVSSPESRAELLDKIAKLKPKHEAEAAVAESYRRLKTANEALAKELSSMQGWRKLSEAQANEFRGALYERMVQPAHNAWLDATARATAVHHPELKIIERGESLAAKAVESASKGGGRWVKMVGLGAAGALASGYALNRLMNSGESSQPQR